MALAGVATTDQSKNLRRERFEPSTAQAVLFYSVCAALCHFARAALSISSRNPLRSSALSLIRGGRFDVQLSLKPFVRFRRGAGIARFKEKTMLNNREERIQELVEFAQEEGIELALSPGQIVDREVAGFVVDLETGAVVGRDTDPAPFPTVQGLAHAAANHLQEVPHESVSHESREIGVITFFGDGDPEELLHVPALKITRGSGQGAESFLLVADGS